MKKRNLGVELFRIVCMLAVCMQHAVHFSNTGAKGFEGRFWNFGVVGFALITGYYGVTFRGSRVVKLWLTAIICSAVSLFVGTSLGFEGGYINLLCNNWYLNGYTVLILLSPVLNAALDNFFSFGVREKTRVAIIAVISLVCWSWFQELYGVRDFVPKVAGMGRQSFMTLVYIYLAGRFLHQYEMPQTISKHRLLIMAACLLLIPILGNYTSPVTILFTVLLFCLFERADVSEQCEKIINLIVPSLFAVYLLHTNTIGFDLISRYCDCLIGLGIARYLSYGICALSVFVVCLVADIPRRLLLKAIPSY